MLFTVSWCLSWIKSCNSLNIEHNTNSPVVDPNLKCCYNLHAWLHGNKQWFSLSCMWEENYFPFSQSSWKMIQNFTLSTQWACFYAQTEFLYQHIWLEFTFLTKLKMCDMNEKMADFCNKCSTTIWIFVDFETDGKWEKCFEELLND